MNYLPPTLASKNLSMEAALKLAPFSTQPNDLMIRIVREDGGLGETLCLPAPAVKLLNDILNELADGRDVALVQTEAELSAQEAADLLNVSRPYFVKLLKAGEIPYRKVGNRHRVKLADALLYQDKMEASRREALKELMKQAQDLNMGY